MTIERPANGLTGQLVDAVTFSQADRTDMPWSTSSLTDGRRLIRLNLDRRDLFLCGSLDICEMAFRVRD
eukprot:CAMPEP_0174236686 /NCGR_PEP_ID=MMETSP0417-20130205/5740_1 /TAXON_ID=242541 /ORGANISM="Mayorella sp, Strain BSH-02190019" /LENGTH=68 /DNA_ID=CAMNT_0015315361 /DNA_START=35 /DNA_END=242 /DNA_ORIENTATION=-